MCVMCAYQYSNSTMLVLICQEWEQLTDLNAFREWWSQVTEACHSRCIWFILSPVVVQNSVLSHVEHRLLPRLSRAAILDSKWLWVWEQQQKKRDWLMPLLYHRPEVSFYLQFWTQGCPVIYLKCSYGLEYLSCSCSGYIVYFFGRTTEKLVFTEYYVLGRF